MSVRQLSFPRISVPLPSYRAFVVALVLVWGVGDALSTLLALGVGGSIGMEGNPLIRAVLAEHLLLLPVFKGVVVGVAGGLLLSVDNYIASVPGWRLWFSGVLALGAAIVVTNLAVAFALVF